MPGVLCLDDIITLSEGVIPEYRKSSVFRNNEYYDKVT